MRESHDYRLTPFGWVTSSWRRQKQVRALRQPRPVSRYRKWNRHRNKCPPSPPIRVMIYPHTSALPLVRNNPYSRSFRLYSLDFWSDRRVVKTGTFNVVRGGTLIPHQYHAAAPKACRAILPRTLLAGECKRLPR
ncbi:hypothetical protein KCP69_17495 [Salmonella enterica subsp. enterica]|nr:hypothetical protein KCP69_17495 [Salmonella enterica subsp. enterica]